MASFASSATTGGARKHAWTKISIFEILIYFSYLDNVAKPPENDFP